MNAFLTLFALLFVLQSCEDFDDDYDIDPKENKIELAKINKSATYDRVVVAGAANVFLTQGTKHKVVLKGNPKHFKYMTFEVDGNSLTCGTRKNNISNMDVDIYVTLPSIKEIKLLGAGEIEMRSFGQLSTFTISISGAGSFDTRGKPTHVKNLDISIAGAGSIDAEDLIGENVAVSVAGAGSADVHATKTLDASVSGVGSIDYEGNPKVRKRVSGIGSISHN
jgi:hypothetical protein